MDERRQGRLFAGAILVLLGLGLFAVQFVEGFGEALILFLIGGAFVAGYLYRRAYGLLIPGCILIGIGLGSLGEGTVFGVGDLSSIGLGLGFIAIYVIALVYQGESHWWPLIPGGILVLLGLAAGSKAFEQLLSVGWPLIIVFVGLILLAGAFGLFGRRPMGE